MMKLRFLAALLLFCSSVTLFPVTTRQAAILSKAASAANCAAISFSGTNTNWTASGAAPVVTSDRTATVPSCGNNGQITITAGDNLNNIQYSTNAGSSWSANIAASASVTISISDAATLRFRIPSSIGAATDTATVKDAQSSATIGSVSLTTTS